MEKLAAEDRSDLYALAKKAYSLVAAVDRNRTVEDVTETLRKVYNPHKNALLAYQPRMDLTFDPAQRQGQLRQRHIILLQHEGRTLTLHQFLGLLEQMRALTQNVLEEQDRLLLTKQDSEQVSAHFRSKIQKERQSANL